MSGEYFCIEEIADTTNYHEEYNGRTHRSSPDGTGNFCKDSDNFSNASKRVRTVVCTIEEQLQLAENRCNSLKGQLDSMKKNCQRSGRSESPPASVKQGKAETSKCYKKDFNGSQVTLKNHFAKNTPVYETYHESTDTIPAKSSSSSSAVVHEVPVNQTKHKFQVPLFRQNSNCIGTDHTGAAVKTINNILSGITESVNRLSHFNSRGDHDQRSKNKHDENYSTNMSVVYGIPGKPFSPRVKQRIFEQQKKVEEIVREGKGDTNPDKDSSASIKSKSSTIDKWAKGVSRKCSKPKNKIQASSANVSISKHVKSIAKHVENTTKMKPIRTSMINEGSHTRISTRKRKSPIKRLRQSSKIALVSRKSSFSSSTQKRFDQFASDKLIELYHNVAAKASDSDENTNINKTSNRIRQKGGGDLSRTAFQIMSGYEGNKPELTTKGLTKVMHTARVLTPIEEQPQPETHSIRDDCITASTKNYELPTISTRLKQVTKCCLQSFNLRSIPFCAAKSITPSHNIGINIQQVMSIIKTRQPITGISPTLAHNISLAASKLQSSPLTAFVTNLSSRMTCGPSTCPLIKRPLNYNKLQEMAKEIKEEPYEEGTTNYIMGDEMYSNEQNADKNGLAPSAPAIWTADSTVQNRCTCTSQKGVPFQQVLSKYQITSEATQLVVKETVQKPPVIRQVELKSAISGTRKQLTASWVKNSTANNSCYTVDPKTDPKTLQGKEKNLKAVLKNLHDEFDALNTKYEELSKEANEDGGDSSKEIAEQLIEMEAALNKKEDEINMVMSLFTEVMALKDQVKKLRLRTSNEALSTISRGIEKREPKTALHLTQLLRQIQNYQNHYKTKL